MNEQGILHIPDSKFCFPLDKQRLVLRLRVDRRDRPERVEVVYESKYVIQQKQQCREMERKYEDRLYAYYEAVLPLEDVRIAYVFRIWENEKGYYFSEDGLNEKYDFSLAYFNFFQLAYINEADIHREAAWMRDAVFYEIFVERFLCGIEGKDKSYINLEWGEKPKPKSFAGGDIPGITKKLDYIQGLGINALYLTPIFCAVSNHKYDIQDYDYIDPHFGRIVVDEGELLPEQNQQNSEATRYINRVTNLANLEASNELFIRVVEEAHRRGMRVILDGVFNHCGSFNKWMDRERIYENAKGYEKGAYVSADSPYRDYFQFHDQNQWPYNGSYDGWWGHDTLPKLNYENSQKLTEYVLAIARKWVSPPYNADGWRLDVAADLGHSQDFNHHFWQEFRRAVKEANPDAIILAEHYGNTRDWLQGNEWDTVMNYDAFMEPVTWFLTGMEKHSDDFREDLLGNAESFWGAMQHHTASFSMPSWQVAMNELSNHDHSRFLTRTNHKVGRISTMGSEAANRDVNKAVFMEAVMMQMTWMGAPTIYYGDEAGVCGFTDPDSRRTYPWGHEDKELVAFHRDIIRLRRENNELRTGSLKYLDSDYNYLAYGRFHRGGQCLILVNNNDHPITKRVFVWEVGMPKVGKVKVLIQTDEEGYHLDGQEYEIKAGKIVIELPKTSAVILKNV